MKKEYKFSFIRYANCWEDSDILLEGLGIKEGEIGLSIASGGDNTLAMLINNPKKVFAFDINKTQLYCTELKIKAIKHLEYGELLEFLGVAESKKRLLLFNKIKSYLTLDCLNYFNMNIKFIEDGIIHAGKFEKYFKIFRKYICPIFCNANKLKEFSKLSDRREQLYYYEKYINNFRFKLIFKLYFGVKVMGTLGRDKSFYKYVDEKSNTAKDIKKRFEFGISNTENIKNEYLCYILNGNYSREALPFYLKKENYCKIKSNIDNIELVYSNIIDLDDNVSFDFLNLSDVFEYMNEVDFRKNIDKLLKLTKEGSRIAYWNMQNKRYLPASMFFTDTQHNYKLFIRNKSFFYRDFSIYVRKL